MLKSRVYNFTILIQLSNKKAFLSNDNRPLANSPHFIVWTSLQEGSEVQVEKMFKLFWGWGWYMYSKVQVQQVWTCLGHVQGSNSPMNRPTDTNENITFCNFVASGKYKYLTRLRSEWVREAILKPLKRYQETHCSIQWNFSVFVPIKTSETKQRLLRQCDDLLLKQWTKILTNACFRRST